MKHILFIIALFIIGTTISCTNENLLVEESQQINKVKFKLFTGSGKSRAALSDLSGEGYTAKITLRSSNGSVFDDTLSINNGNAEYNLAEGQYVLEQCEISKYDSLRYHLRDTVKFDVNEKRDSLYEPIDIYVDQITSCYFDWENCYNVLNDPSLPLLPWVNSASTSVPRNISMDYKKEDGWEMVHNNFKLTNGTIPDKKYLIFYNKYTGMLRFWYYHQGSTNTSSLKYAIQTLGSSSLLNFNTDFAKPMDQRNPSYIEYYSGDESIPSSLGLVSDQWYLFEFELAYDDKCRSIPANMNDLMISARGINEYLVDLTGSTTGKIEGSIVFNNLNGKSLFNVNNININNKIKEETLPNGTTYPCPITGNSIQNASEGVNIDTRTSNTDSWWSGIADKIDSSIKQSIGNAVGSLANSALNLATNPISSFVNSLIHYGKPNNATVNLSLSTRTEISGTISTQLPVNCSNLVIPGSSSNGVVYIYNKPVGVFNLSTTPIVRYQQAYWRNSPKGPRYYQFFDIDNSSFSFVINPAIRNDIEILNQNVYLMLYKRYEGSTILVPPVELGRVDTSKLQLTFMTKNKYTMCRFDDGFEFYKVLEGFYMPTTGINCGVMYDPQNIPDQNFTTGAKIKPDNRIVVKAELQFKIKATGQQVTMVKTYLPNFVDSQEMPLVIN